MIGGDILLGHVKLHSVREDPGSEQGRAIRGVLAYTEQTDAFNWAVIYGDGRDSPVKINVLIVDELFVSDSAGYIHDESLRCVSTDRLVAQVRTTLRGSMDNTSGCHLFFDGSEMRGSSSLKVSVHLTHFSRPASAEVTFRIWFPSTVRVVERKPRDRSTLVPKENSQSSETAILRPVEGWYRNCSRKQVVLPPFAF